MIANMNKNSGKLLAALMAMVMVFAAVAVVSGTESYAATSDDPTELGGPITDSQSFGAGTNVQVTNDLYIPNGMELTIGGKFTVPSDYTVYVQKGGALYLMPGVSATFDGDLVVEDGGKVYNGAVTDSVNKKYGSPLGLYINGDLTVAKGGYILGYEITPTKTEGSDTSTYKLVQPVDHNTGEAVGSTSGSITADSEGNTTTLTFNDATTEWHMNGAGNYGYWVGITFDANGTPGANAQVKYDGRASSPADTFGADGSLTIWINAGLQTQTVTYVVGTTTYTLIIDSTGVALGEDATAGQYSGQIVIGPEATMSSASTNSSPSAIADQTIFAMSGSNIDLDSVMQNVTVSAYASSGIYTYGSISISDDDAISNGAIKDDAKAQSLDITVVSDRITAFVGKDYSSAAASSRAYALSLDVAGTIESGYTLTVNGTKAIAGSDNNLYYPDPTDAEKASNVLINGTVTVSGTLNVADGGKLVTSTGSNTIVTSTGSITESGKKIEAKEENKGSSFELSGNIYVAGKVTIGNVVEKDADQVATLNINGAYLIIQGDGVVSIMDYELDTESFENAPAGTYGATYTNSDGAFIVTSLTKALADAVADDVYEISVWGIDATINNTGSKILPMPYIVDADMTIPDDVELTVNNRLVVSEGVTLTIAESAEILGNMGLIVVDGTMIDYSMENRDYRAEIETGNVYVDAEVRFVDANDTYYMYTSLAQALAGDAGTIDLFGDVNVKKDMTIPAGFTIVLDGHKLIIENEATLTVDGVIDSSATDKGTSTIIIYDATADKEAGALVLNNMIVNPNIVDNNTPVANSINNEIAGFVAFGTIGDYEDANFILSASVAAANSATLENITSQGKVTYNGTLTFATGENNDGEVLDIASEVSISNIVLDGYGFQISAGTFTGTVETAVTAGTSSVSFNKAVGYTLGIVERDDGQAVATYMTLGVMDDPVQKKGGVTISSGTVELTDSVTFGASKDDVLKISTGATLAVTDGTKITIVQAMDASTPKNDIYAAVTVDGTLEVREGGDIDYSNIKGTNTAKAVFQINGTMTVDASIDLDDDVYVDGTITVLENGKINLMGDMFVNGAISGIIDFASENDYVIAYPGASVEGALFNMNAGESGAASTALYINGDIYMTIYALKNAPVVNGIYDAQPSIPGYEAIIYDETNQTKVYTDAAYENQMDLDAIVEDTAAAYIKLDPKSVDIQVSVGPQMSVFIDGIRVTNEIYGEAFSFTTVGDHKVEVTVNPGFNGDVSIIFNGQTIQNGGIITITSEMAEADNTTYLLSVTGNLSQDNVVVDGGNNGDSGMGLTDYLLIILVVLIVIMAIMVAMRLMRS